MYRVSVFQRAAVSQLLMTVIGCLLVVLPAIAHHKAVTVFPFTVTVRPASANAGTPRKISIESTWQNSCADAVFDPSVNPPILVIRLAVNSHAKLCAKGATPYKQEVLFTPARDGEVALYASAIDGRFLAQSKIVSEPVFDF